jgi:ribosomal protein S18 acetylase RimI-like enzyme
MSFELRPPTLEDVPALAELQASVHGGMSETQLRDRFLSPRSNTEQDWRLAVGRQGEVIGSAAVWHPAPDAERVFVSAITHPRAAVVYERLLDWGEERARRLTEGRSGRTHTSADSENDLLGGILRERGYDLVRHFFTMEIDLEHEPERPIWPEGISVRTFRLGEERAVYDLDMEAFQDHWDFFPVPFEEWRDYFLGGSRFEPGLWFLGEDGDEIAASALCAWESRPGIGRVNVLAVRRPWRRQGLGTALLLHAFREFRRRGRERVDLNVDAENLTGAVRLYERAGMRVAHRDDSYRKEL